MAEQLEQRDPASRRRSCPRAFGRRHAMAQMAALAHREKLPETTTALDRFLDHWSAGDGSFEELVCAWSRAAPADPDRDRVGVFWALLFLCGQGRVDLHQDQGLYGPLTVQVLPRPGSHSRRAAARGRLAALRMAPPRAA